MVWPWFSWEILCVCQQFSVSRQRHDLFWIFPTVPCNAFCMWHWPIGLHLDLSSIWGHHHLSGFVNISRPAEYFTACYTVLKRPNKVETAVHAVYHVVAPLSFLRSISLALLLTLFALVLHLNCTALSQSESSNFFMSIIRSEIIRVISKSNKCAARVQFEITSMVSDQNCTTRSSITTLLDPFWNRAI